MEFDVYWGAYPRSGEPQPQALGRRGVVAFTLYNTLRFCDGCIRSLDEQLPPEVDIVAVDNGSSENLAEVLHKRHPRIHCLRVHENHGVASGWNVACEFAFSHGARLLYLANDDILAQPGLWEHCERAMDEHGPGLVASIARDIDPPHLVQSAGMDVDLRGMRILLLNQRRPYGKDLQQYMPVHSFVGVGFMIAREVWEKIGCFDENYHVLYEETDYCTRARLAGFPVGIAGESTLHHFESQTVGRYTSPRYLYYYFRNLAWFARKNMQARHYRFRGRLAPLKKALLFLYREKAVRASPTRAGAMFRGVWDGWTHQPGDNRLPAFLRGIPKPERTVSRDAAKEPSVLPQAGHG